MRRNQQLMQKRNIFGGKSIKFPDITQAQAQAQALLWQLHTALEQITQHVQHTQNQAVT
jgi:hypothetical protein